MLQFFNLLNIGLATQVSFSTNKVFQQLQPDQNMMAPELSGIHMNSSFEVPSYFGRAVLFPNSLILTDLAHMSPDDLETSWSHTTG